MATIAVVRLLQIQNPHYVADHPSSGNSQLPVAGRNGEPTGIFSVRKPRHLLRRTAMERSAPNIANAILGSKIQQGVSVCRPVSLGVFDVKMHFDRTSFPRYRYHAVNRSHRVCAQDQLPVRRDRRHNDWFLRNLDRRAAIDGNFHQLVFGSQRKIQHPIAIGGRLM